MSCNHFVPNLKTSEAYDDMGPPGLKIKKDGRWSTQAENNLNLRDFMGSA